MNILIISTIVFFSMLSLSSENSSIEWHEQRPLTWDDFIGPPNKNSPHEAETHYEISYSFSQLGNKYEFDVICNFSPNKSWVKNNANDYLLNHEQIHFNIAEIFTRRMRKEFKTIKYDDKDIQAKIKKKYRTLMMECNRLQQQYDKETNHSKNKLIQEDWNKKVALMLKNTDTYKRQ